MPRYMVERSFPDGLRIPVNDEGAEKCRMVVLNNEEDSVTWIQSYVSDDGKTCRSIALLRCAFSTLISIADWDSNRLIHGAHSRRDVFRLHATREARTQIVDQTAV